MQRNGEHRGGLGRSLSPERRSELARPNSERPIGKSASPTFGRSNGDEPADDEASEAAAAAAARAKRGVSFIDMGDANESTRSVTVTTESPVLAHRQID